MPDVIGTYTVSGASSSEASHLKLSYSTGAVSVSGTTASCTISATLYVNRDSYGPSYGMPYTAYITIDGTATKGSGTPTSSQAIGTSYKQILTASKTVTWTVATGGTSKTISLAASFDMPGVTKLAGLILPTSSYSKGSASQSGSLSFTLTASPSVTYTPVYVASGGSYKKGYVYYATGGTWKQVNIYAGSGGSWKPGVS